MLVTLNSDLLANGLKCPPGKRRIEYVDSGGVTGLYVEARATGEKTFYLRYKDVHGKTCHQRIGSTKEVTLADARACAKRLKAEICLGADPRAAAKARKAVPTFSEFFENHYLPHAKLHKRSWDRDEELYRLRIKKVLGHRRLTEITRHQLQLFHTALAAEGLAAATSNHHIKLIKHALNLAIDWGMLEKNPAARMPMFHEDNQIERYLDDAQLQRLMGVLRSDRNRAVCNIALFLLSTGCRLNEVLSAKWADVDQEKRVFVIRASCSKSKKARSVPLNDSALEVLNGLDTKQEFDHLFINRGTRMPYTTIAKQWDRIRKTAGLPQLRIHDLRHSFLSYVVCAGFSLFSAQILAGHKNPITTMRYAKLSTKALQDASDSASVKIQGALKPAA